MSEPAAAPQERHRVLIVDDEPPIVRVLKPSLAACGYDVAVAENGAAALSQIAQWAPDVIILDLGLPDMDGKRIIEQMREWSHAPIIVLSARHEAEERIASLDLGADDYITKPFHMGELQARLRTALRHRERRLSDQPSYAGAGLEIDFAKRRVTIDGEEIKLTRKEYDLLRTLAQHAGQVVTHRQLLAAGWGAAVTDTQFVRVYVGQLRQKLEADSSRPTLILTEPGIGYRLRADEND
jgi:two-component system KDP operon response regulator KdpE